MPIVKVSDEIKNDLINWMPVSDDILDAHLLYLDITAFVNQFNRYWFNSAAINMQQLIEMYPDLTDKHVCFFIHDRGRCSAGSTFVHLTLIRINPM